MVWYILKNSSIKESTIDIYIRAQSAKEADILGTHNSVRAHRGSPRNHVTTSPLSHSAGGWSQRMYSSIVVLKCMVYYVTIMYTNYYNSVKRANIPDNRDNTI